MKQYYILIVLILAACSASQFTYYKPSEDEQAWRISVEKGTWENFICSINDSVVIDESFPLIGFNYNSFEKDGTYRDRNIKMSGFRIANESVDANGVKTTTYAYQIRLFIDKEEIAIFAF